MSVTRTPRKISYPDADGKPMAESDLHRDWMVRILDLLKRRYRGEQVYISGNLFVYYEEGNPKKCVSPDAFVVRGRSSENRRTYKVWEEGGLPPEVVFETTSRKTKKNDTDVKPGRYLEMGVKEYFLYDPTSDYLKPPIRGFRRIGDSFIPIESDAAGWLSSEILGLSLGLDGRDLVIRDTKTGEVLLTDVEAEHNSRNAAEAAQRLAEEKIRSLEAELARFRAGAG